MLTKNMKEIYNFKKNTKFENFYIGLRTLYLILITVSLFGIGAVSPEIMTYFQIAIKLVIALYLIIVFNLFRVKNKINRKEQAIVYSAGIYLLFSTSIGAYVIKYIKDHPTIKKYHPLKRILSSVKTSVV